MDYTHGYTTVISQCVYEQRMGVGILVNIAASPWFGDAALRLVGTSAAVMEQLVEMLSWKGATEAGTHASPTLVVSKLASKKRNALRVAGVPDTIRCLSSMLYAADKECNLLGLLIIKKLTHDHDNCSKIGAEVLTCLVMDADARKKIDGTGGVVSRLLAMFLKPSSRTVYPVVRGLDDGGSGGQQARGRQIRRQRAQGRWIQWP